MIEREYDQTAILGAHIPVAIIGINLPAEIRAKEINSCDSVREFYTRFHVPRELSRVLLDRSHRTKHLNTRPESDRTN